MWRDLEIYGDVRLSLPAEASCEVMNDGQTLAVKLPTRPQTELLISRHPIPHTWEEAPFLVNAVRTFFTDVLATEGETTIGTSIETLPREVYQRTVVQGVAADERNDAYWLVRAYGFEGEYLWLQWTGPKKLMGEPVLRILESVAPSS